jgi:S1-C subfamily serine protease
VLEKIEKLLPVLLPPTTTANSKINGDKPFAKITMVDPDTPASKSGLLPGDLIVRVGNGGKRVIEEVRKELEKVPVIRVLRNGRVLVVSLEFDVNEPLGCRIMPL